MKYFFSIVLTIGFFISTSAFGWETQTGDINIYANRDWTSYQWGEPSSLRGTGAQNYMRPSDMHTDKFNHYRYETHANNNPVVYSDDGVSVNGGPTTVTIGPNGERLYSGPGSSFTQTTNGYGGTATQGIGGVRIGGQ